MVKQLVEIFIDYVGILMNLECFEEVVEKLDKVLKFLKNFLDQCFSVYMICWEGFMNFYYKNYFKVIEFFLNVEKMIQ